MNARHALLALLALGSLNCGGYDESDNDVGDAENLTFSTSDELVVAPNLALFKPTTQSITAYGGDSARAVDGNTDGNYGSGSVSHTPYGTPGFWQVDLLSVQPVGEVVIFNRTDCCDGYLANFTVRVSADGANWTDFFQPGSAKRETHVTVDRQARYVRIENPDSLQLAEVQVFRTKNLAYGKPATQSSTDFGGDASKAVDGSTDGDYGHGSVSHTGWGYGWWQVDLQKINRIGNIVLFNRTDCCSNQLHDFTVKVSNDGQNWHSIPFQNATPRILVPVNREARYVRVENGEGYLHLAEVQVFEGPRVPGFTYGRGVGSVPTYQCSAGQVMDAGLCYPDCAPGYDGVGPVCWEKCSYGYTDHGMTCTNWSTWHTYGKNAYGRGVGVIPNAICAPDEDLDAGLCYPKWDPGYHGVGPVCWADVIDIGDIAKTVCDAFRMPIMSDVAKELGDAVTVGVGASVAAISQLSGELGVAYGPNGEYGCYVTGCYGLSSSIAISAYASGGVYNDFASIEGDSLVTSAGFSTGIPGTPVAFGGTIGFVSTLQGQPIGTTIAASVSVGLDAIIPIDLSALTCHTAMLQTQD